MILREVKNPVAITVAYPSIGSTQLVVNARETQNSTPEPVPRIIISGQTASTACRQWTRNAVGAGLVRCTPDGTVVSSAAVGQCRGAQMANIVKQAPTVILVGWVCGGGV